MTLTENPDTDFIDSCETFYALMEGKVIKKTIRGQQNLPKLKYTVKGNYTYIENYQALLNYCNRSIAHLTRFFTLKLGCAMEHQQQLLRIRGVAKKDSLKHVEKQFYYKEVLCFYCNSPETKRNGAEIMCLNCNQTRTVT